MSAVRVMLTAGVVLGGLALAACGAESTATGESRAIDDPTTTEGSTTTMPILSDDTDFMASAELFLVTVRERSGTTSQELINAVEELSYALPIKLEPGDFAEDGQSWNEIVFSLPLAKISDGAEGFYLLSVTTADRKPVEIHQASWQLEESSAVLTLETTSSVQLEATWGYSLRPRMRAVFLADDDGSLGFETSVLHVADFGPGPVGADSKDPGSGLGRSTFTTPLWLVDQTPLAEACELVVGELGDRVGTNDLQWPLDALDDRLLEDVATAVEQRLPEGQQVNLVVEAEGREVIRGKRLQPFVRYPVTLLDSSQNPTAATLGCSISPS